MKRIASLFAALVLTVGFVNGSQAAVTVAFPDATATVVASNCGQGVGCFWSVARGDKITQVIDGNGLTSVSQLDLQLDLVFSNLAAGNQVDWEALLNGSSIGTFSILNTVAAPSLLNYTFNFAGVAGIGTGSDDYTLLLRVTNEVPGGAGSVGIGRQGSATLNGVPEPTTIALLGLGLAGLATTRRRRQ